MRMIFSFICFLFLFGCATTPKEYLVSHILTSTEQEAQVALNRIHAGESFESVAKEVSKDPGSKYRGGQLKYWTTANSFVPRFATELEQLGVGQISTAPFQTEYGWHIVKINGIR